MPRRAVPARFMSNASSKNLAEASGSSTMMAMWRSLDMTGFLSVCGRHDAAKAGRRQSRFSPALASEASGQRGHFVVAAPAPRVASRHSAARLVVDRVHVVVGIDDRLD